MELHHGKQTPLGMKASRGFTIPEFMIATFIGFITMALVWVAFMGFQFQTRTTFAQTLNTHNTQKTMEKIGRIIMQSTDLEIESNEEDLGIVHIWRDTQEVWTPNSTDDDVEGLMFYDEEEKKIWYRPDVDKAAEVELVAERIEGIDFDLVGDAVFVTIETDYDVDPNHLVNSEETIRKTYASYAVRNNPRIRIGATF